MTFWATIFPCRFDEPLCALNWGGCRCGKGKKKETTNIQVEPPKPSAEETEFNRMALDRERALQPYLLPAQQSSLQLLQALTTGGQLPGYLSGLEEGISPEITQEIVNKSILDIAPEFQQAGLLDSGVRASISARVAGDIRRNAAEFNLRNRYNLLTSALGGQGQVQEPIAGFSGQFSQRLQGLRQAGNMTTTTKGMNPFLQSFYTTMGNSPQWIAQAVASSQGCWIAAEVFGGWDKLETQLARYYLNTLAPAWFRSLYLTFGRPVAWLVRHVPLLKSWFRPVFLRWGQDVLDKAQEDSCHN